MRWHRMAVAVLVVALLLGFRHEGPSPTPAELARGGTIRQPCVALGGGADCLSRRRLPVVGRQRQARAALPAIIATTRLPGGAGTCRSDRP